MLHTMPQPDAPICLPLRIGACGFSLTAGGGGALSPGLAPLRFAPSFLTSWLVLFREMPARGF